MRSEAPENVYLNETFFFSKFLQTPKNAEKAKRFTHVEYPQIVNSTLKLIKQLYTVILFHVLFFYSNLKQVFKTF